MLQKTRIKLRVYVRHSLLKQNLGVRLIHYSYLIAMVELPPPPPLNKK
jgi:hypothetical protein